MLKLNKSIYLPKPNGYSPKLQPVCSYLETSWISCLIGGEGELDDTHQYKYADRGKVYVTEASGKVFQTQLLQKNLNLQNGLCLTGPAAGTVASIRSKRDIHTHFPIENTFRLLPNRIISYLTLRSAKQIDGRTLQDYVTNPYSNQWILLRTLLYDKSVYLDHPTYQTLLNSRHPMAQITLKACSNDFKDISYAELMIELIKFNGHEIDENQFLSNIQAYSAQFRQ